MYPTPQKNPLLKRFKHHGKKLYSLAIILIPWGNLKPLEKYQHPPPPQKQKNLSIPLNKLSFKITHEITTPPEKMSDTSENISIHPRNNLNAPS